MKAQRKLRMGGMAALAVLGASLLAAPARAVEFDVTTNADTLDLSPGDGFCADSEGQCSLRAAVQEANALSGADVIRLTSDEPYPLTRDGAGENSAQTGDLDITDDLSIVGRPGNTALYTPLPFLDRMFQVLNGAVVHLSNLVMSGGHVEGDGGCVLVSNGALSVSDGEIHFCRAFRGGAIAVIDGSLMLDRVTLRDNVAGSRNGAGLFNRGSATLLNVTVAENDENGLSNHGTLLVTNSTISGNSAPYGTGVGLINSGTVTLRNTILADNISYTQRSSVVVNCYNTGILISSHSLESRSDCGLAGPGDKQDADAALGTLGAYGGQAKTVPILAGSEAYNAGDDAVCPPTDQRGEPRIDCDIGAYEAPNPADLWVTLRDGADPVAQGDSIRYEIVVTNNGLSSAQSVELSVDLAQGLSLVSTQASQGSCDALVPLHWPPQQNLWAIGGVGRFPSA